MGDNKSLLTRYYNILEENETAKYLRCKQISVSYKKSETTKSLWKKHDNALNKKPSNVEPEQSLLDLKIELSSRIFLECSFCERRCKVDRNKKTGNC